MYKLKRTFIGTKQLTSYYNLKVNMLAKQYSDFLFFVIILIKIILKYDNKLKVRIKNIILLIS